MKPNNSRMALAFSQTPDAGLSAAQLAVQQAVEAKHREDDLDGSMMTLNVEDIHVYDKDPRTGPNPKFAEIRASMLAQGNNHRFSVTRRPGDSRYFVAAGGNTRLKIIKELWETTQDPKWKTLDVIYRKWRSETNVLVAHLAENEARADTTFWDKAWGIATLKAEIEAEKGAEVTAVEVTETLRRSGLDRSQRYVQMALFVAETLRPIGPWLDLRPVNEFISPAYRGMNQLGKNLNLPAPTANQVMTDCMIAVGERLKEQQLRGDADVALDPAGLVADWHRAMAARLETTPERLALMLDALEINPRVGADVLNALARGDTVAGSGSTMVAPAPKTVVPSANKTPAGNPGTGSQATGSRAPSPGQAAGALQMPLQGTMGPVTLPSAPADSDDSLTMAAVAAWEHDLGNLPELDGPLPVDWPSAYPEGQYRIALLHAHIASVLSDMMPVAELDGLIHMMQPLSLGYYLELPENGFAENIVGGLVEDVSLRRSTWLVLAALSGQFDLRNVQRMPEGAGNCMWRTLSDAGRLEEALEGMLHHGMPDGSVEPWTMATAASGAHFYEVACHPTLGPLLIRLLELVRRIADFGETVHLPRIGQPAVL